MKKVLISIMLIVSLIVVIGIVYAEHIHGTGQEATPSTTTNIEDLKKFQKETLSLRDELITKRFELKNEYSKSPKDYSRIATLRKEIAEIRTKIEAIADKYAIKDIRAMDGGMMRRGMMQDGMGHGRKGMMCDGMGKVIKA
jgi:ribosomal protein L29